MDKLLQSLSYFMSLFWKKTNFQNRFYCFLSKRFSNSFILFFAFFVVLLSANFSFGQSTIYRSFTSGNWNIANTWESSTDNGINWSAATVAPSSSDGTITIQSGHTVTITANVTIDQTTINSGGIVILSAGTLTVANGAEAQDLIINGTYERTSVSTTMATTGVVFCGNGGRYIHNVNGGTLPTISWHSNSTLQIEQSISHNEFTETFGNIIINGSSSFSMYNSSVSTTMNIAGNLTFNSSGTVYISGPACTNTQTFT
jgi:hypothetical protein